MKFTLILLPLFALYVNIVAADVDWTKANVSPGRTLTSTCNVNPIIIAIDAIQSKVSIMNPTVGKIILSDQQILDCTPALVTDCKKGKVDDIYTYLQSTNLPIATGASYPFTGTQSPCAYATATPSKAKLIKFIKVTPQTVAGLEAAIVNGPVVVNMDASDASFKTLAANVIFKPTACATTLDKLNYWALLVATRTDATGGKQWVFKSSEGDKWGTYGFFKMVRDTTNICGIATNAMYPILDPALLL